MEPTAKQVSAANRILEQLEVVELSQGLDDKIHEILQANEKLISRHYSDTLSRSDYKGLLDTLFGISGIIDSASQTAKWAKHGGEWVIKGPQSLMIEGKAVTVKKASGQAQECIVGEIIHSDDTYHYAKVGKPVGDFCDPEDGMVYRNSKDEIVRTWLTNSGQMVAAILQADNSFEYVGKRGLNDLVEQLDLDEVSQYGKKTGVCMSCLRKLTNEESVLDGIGPICKGKFQ